MSTEDAPLPSAPRIEGPPPHLLLVRAPYYRAVIDGLTDGATRILREAGATFEQLEGDPHRHARLEAVRRVHRTRLHRARRDRSL